MMAMNRGAGGEGSFSQGNSEGEVRYIFFFIFCLFPGKFLRFFFQVVEEMICIRSYGRHVQVHWWMFPSEVKECFIFLKVIWNR